jgi:hypothetical protein
LLQVRPSMRKLANVFDERCGHDLL